MMQHKKIDVRYFENEKYQMISLPYNLRNFSLVIVLPNNKSSLPPILGNEMLKNMMRCMTASKVHVEIPKFEHEEVIDLG